MVIIQIRWFKSVWKDKEDIEREGRSQEALMLVPVHTDRYRKLKAAKARLGEIFSQCSDLI